MPNRKNGSMIKIDNPAQEEWPVICKRPIRDLSEIQAVAQPIFEEVENMGDLALKKYSAKFDRVDIDDFQVDSKTIREAEGLLNKDLKTAINTAYSNIYNFHNAQKSARIQVETLEEVVCWQEKRPIQKVGLYIPGGTAPLFSTVLMLAIPAKIAGCQEVVLCTPPDEEGSVNPAILYTANLCGIDKIFRIGGIQSIAALTYGTETVPKVYKIFGPGNQYVTVAKQMATNYGVAIDMPAGPSEVLVMADRTADPSFVASDLLSQAEHGTDSQVILVSTDKELLSRTEEQVKEQLDALPRKSIAEQAIMNSKMILFNSEEAAADFVNEYGPEHYIINCENEDFFLDKVQNAGSVFVGKYTPESAGDYASGTNHTLPTNGYAKQYSGVNLDSFLKSITFQKISEKGLMNLGPTIETMADAEGLYAHKNAVSLRLTSIKSNKADGI